eukprot:5772754-Amphidinium_carterae.1
MTQIGRSDAHEISPLAKWEEMTLEFADATPQHSAKVQQLFHRRHVAFIQEYCRPVHGFHRYSRANRLATNDAD